jgi:hypothetical protein
MEEGLPIYKHGRRLANIQTQKWKKACQYTNTNMEEGLPIYKHKHGRRFTSNTTHRLSLVY